MAFFLISDGMQKIFTGFLSLFFFIQASGQQKVVYDLQFDLTELSARWRFGTPLHSILPLRYLLKS